MMNTLKNGKKIYDWIMRNHSPLTWSFIAFKIGDQFLESEVDPFFIEQSTEFNLTLVAKINHVLQIHYDSELPKYLYN